LDQQPRFPAEGNSLVVHQRLDGKAGRLEKTKACFCFNNGRDAKTATATTTTTTTTAAAAAATTTLLLHYYYYYYYYDEFYVYYLIMLNHGLHGQVSGCHQLPVTASKQRSVVVAAAVAGE